MIVGEGVDMASWRVAFGTGICLCHHFFFHGKGIPVLLISKESRRMGLVYTYMRGQCMVLNSESDM